MRVLMCVAALAASAVVWANDYSSGWGVPVGEPAPALAAPDQTGAERDLASISGENGVLLFFNRSTDW